MKKEHRITPAPERIISISEMSRLTSRTPKTLWRWHAKEGVFPKPVIQHGRTLGWKESAYNEWLASKSEV